MHKYFSKSVLDLKVYLQSDFFVNLCLFLGRKTVPREGEPSLTITSCGMMLQSPIPPHTINRVEGVLEAMMQSIACIKAINLN